ncbi:hypothetical protein [Leucobacter denitrificans]|uniref:Uncharacterized protein n=1 Tax=Leucobacter denitrificans TaxID=683042 RepID=A0A7G9S4E5_9MICO|nr:hypothetical protein [Leucobacter denitrificans]QNN62720.1 hypothetical protein H9L06_10940 [Leucobacter denitrificans]
MAEQALSVKTGRCEQTVRELWGMLLEFPGLIQKSRRVEDLLLACLYVLSVDGDIARKVTIDDDGVLTLITSDRGNDRITFVTNSVRAFVVQLAYRALNGRADFYPGPKRDVPPGDLQNLSLSEWEQWRAELLSPEVDH